MSGFPVLSHFTSLSPKSHIIISGIFHYFHLILKLLLKFSFLHLFILLFLCYDRTDCYESNLFISLERGISMNFITKSWKGILLCLVIAVPCWFLGQTFPIIGGPVFGILAGMIITLLLKNKSMFQDGITFVSKKVLQYAVILLGFGLNLSVILETGKQSLPIIVTTISTSLIIAYLLHKVMHVPGNISTLVGVGSSICGGSAIAATAPVIDADDEEVAQAISVIFFFNMLAALFFPSLGALLGFSTKSGEAFGIFAGTAINDTSSVTAAASTGIRSTLSVLPHWIRQLRSNLPERSRSSRSHWFSHLSGHAAPKPKERKWNLKRFSRCSSSTLFSLP